MLFELRETEQTNASDYNCSCIFTWCYMQTCCCLSDLCWCARVWGRGSKLWFGLQVAMQFMAFQYCLPPPSDLLICVMSSALRRNLMVAGLWRIQNGHSVSKWQLVVPEPAEQSMSLKEPCTDYVLVLMIYLSLRFAWTFVLCCSGTRNGQAFMRDWGSWINPWRTWVGWGRIWLCDSTETGRWQPVIVT